MIAETLAPEMLGMLADSCHVEPFLHRLRDGVAERFSRELVYKQAGFSMSHGFDCASSS